MKYLKKPNLPENTVCQIIANGYMNIAAKSALEDIGITIIDTPKLDKVDKFISKHADISILHLSDNKFICDPESQFYYESVLYNANVCSGGGLSIKYPGDVLYNSAIIGEYIICNERATDAQILDFVRKNGLYVINTAQGYSKCNTCIIAEKAIITSDINISRAAGKFGIDTLLTDDSTVKLDGYNHGFFGGASGLIAPDKLAVNGDIRKHKNADEIIMFASKYNVEIISLSDDYITDIGSILPVIEN